MVECERLFKRHIAPRRTVLHVCADHDGPPFGPREQVVNSTPSPVTNVLHALYQSVGQKPADTYKNLSPTLRIGPRTQRHVRPLVTAAESGFDGVVLGMDVPKMRAIEVGVNLSGRYRLMPEHHLHGSKIGASLNEMRCE